MVTEFSNTSAEQLIDFRLLFIVVKLGWLYEFVLSLLSHLDADGDVLTA